MQENNYKQTQANEKKTVIKLTIATSLLYWLMLFADNYHLVHVQRLDINLYY